MGCREQMRKMVESEHQGFSDHWLLGVREGEESGNKGFWDPELGTGFVPSEAVVIVMRK